MTDEDQPADEPADEPVDELPEDLDASAYVGLPPLTPGQRAELDALAAMPDKAINTSDLPELKAKFWKNAVRNPLYRPTKTLTSVRIDTDVLVWLRGQGRGYQTRLNAILRREMLKNHS